MTLKVDLLDGFLALVPDGDPAPLSDSRSAACASSTASASRPSEDELARRRKAAAHRRGRTPISLRWGYPYVLDDFRFHMTLTERLEPGDAGAPRWPRRRRISPPTSRAPVLIDGITLFQEPAPGAPFLALRHFPFTLSAAEAAA